MPLMQIVVEHGILHCSSDGVWEECYTLGTQELLTSWQEQMRTSDFDGIGATETKLVFAFSPQWDLMPFFKVWFGFFKSPFPPQTHMASSCTGFVSGCRNFSHFAFHGIPLSASHTHMQHSQSCCRSTGALALGVLRHKAEPHLLS